MIHCLQAGSFLPSLQDLVYRDTGVRTRLVENSVFSAGFHCVQPFPQVMSDSFRGVSRPLPHHVPVRSLLSNLVQRWDVS